MVNINLDDYSVTELIDLYSKIIKNLKDRDVIRTNNLIGEIGEYIAIEYYNKTAGLPNLQSAPIGTENIDAISRNGERYSIKSASGKTTGVFYGLQPPESSIPDKQKFEYVIICSFSKDYELLGIYELTWDQFIEYKHWHSTMKAWNLALNKELLSAAKVIYSKQ